MTTKIVTAVVETSVFGVKAWNARCLCPGCGFEGKRRSTEAKALAEAKQHGAEHVSVERVEQVAKAI